MHPPFSFEKENGPCTVQKKTISAQMPQHLGEKRGSSESVQPETGALLPSAPYSRHQPTAPPHNRCNAKPGWSTKGLSVYSRAFRFATRCRVRTRQRQQKEKRGHTMIAPFKIGPPSAGTGLWCRSTPAHSAGDFRTLRAASEKTPYLRTGGCATCIRRFVPASFLLTGRGRFLFDASKRK